MKLFVCDQDQSIAESYKRCIENHLQQKRIAGTVKVCESGERLLYELSDDASDADIIFSDTEFDGKMDGIAAIRNLRDVGYEGIVIFMTNTADRVFESFEVHPFNYLLKEKASLERFVEVLDEAVEVAGKQKRETITFSCAGENRTIAIEDITYFELVSRIVEVHYGDEIFEIYSTIEKLENQLYGKNFMRTHKAFLVNAAHVESVKEQELIMDTGEVVPIAGKYSKYFREVINGDANG